MAKNMWDSMDRGDWHVKSGINNVNMNTGNVCMAILRIMAHVSKNHTSTMLLSLKLITFAKK